MLPRVFEADIEVDGPELLKQVARRGGFWCTSAIHVRTPKPPCPLSRACRSRIVPTSHFIEYHGGEPR